MIRCSKMLYVGLAAFLITVASGGFALAQPGEANPGGTRHVVEIRGLQFQPSELHVVPGDTVAWINRDIVPHTATGVDTAWSSGGLASGESWELAVQTAGTVRYYCEYHPTMQAKIIAKGA